MTYQQEMARIKAATERIRATGEEFKREMEALDVEPSPELFIDIEALGYECHAGPGPGAVFAVRASRMDLPSPHQVDRITGGGTLIRHYTRDEL